MERLICISVDLLPFRGDFKRNRKKSVDTFPRAEQWGTVTTHAFHNALLSYASRQYVTTYLLSPIITWQIIAWPRDRLFCTIGTYIWCPSFGTCLSGSRHIQMPAYAICGTDSLIHSHTHSHILSGRFGDPRRKEHQASVIRLRVWVPKAEINGAIERNANS